MILERIQQLCQKRGISVNQLENKLGFGNGTIYKWKTVSPSVSKLQEVARFFNEPMDYFIK